ncbi:oxidoreductase [Nakamurella flava]|uniref:Oxidoreductase n=1 Tax=Nakamurella flava TaxID=2576308 RepID=A0A4U6QKX0_9ACTN|nr:ferredoxin reductase family protein [Nakamurella flava]TKV60772.1 oxidoreductase [Nakamurella flava]
MSVRPFASPPLTPAASTATFPPSPAPAGVTVRSPTVWGEGRSLRPSVDTTRARRDALVRRLVVAALVGATGLVIWWWATGGGIRDLHGWVSGLDSAGRLTGLVSAVLLLFQVLAMARIPLVERAFGQERLARGHRLLGFTSFTLMFAHLGLITWGYAGGRLLSTPGTAWELTVDDPGMLIAVAGTACLVMVVVTSVKAARRRLRYESWHLLHLYAYLGVGLALPHQLWTGQEFTSSPGRVVFWWGLWIAATLAILVWRVGLPLVRSARYGLRVTEVVTEGPGVVSVHLSGREQGPRPEAGQFFTFRFLSGRGWTRAHPYSLSAAPVDGRLRFTARIVGDGTAALAALRPGTRVLVEGPHGRLSARARTRPRVALIGAGVGVAPLRALAEALPYAPGDAVLIYRFTDQPLFARELRALADHRGLQVVYLPGIRRSPDSWLGAGVPPIDDAAALRTLVPDIADRDVFACGPDAWATSLRRSAVAAGLPAGRFHTETFGW